MHRRVLGYIRHISAVTSEGLMDKQQVFLIDRKIRSRLREIGNDLDGRRKPSGVSIQDPSVIEEAAEQELLRV